MYSTETGFLYSLMSIVLLALLFPREPCEGRTRFPMGQRSSSSLEPTSRGRTNVKETKISLVLRSHNQNNPRTHLLGTTSYFQARYFLSVSLLLSHPLIASLIQTSLCLSVHRIQPVPWESHRSTDHPNHSSKQQQSHHVEPDP